MRNLKSIAAAITMMTVIAFSTTFANAGIIVAGFDRDTTKTTSEEPCTEPTGKPDWGIIVAGYGGIIVAGFVGIIVAGAVETPSTECGIIVAG